MDHRLIRAAALVAAGALLVPGAALAKGKPHTKKAKRPHTVMHTLHGAVASVDVAGSTVVVTVRRANRHGRALVGKDLSLSLGAARLSVADVNGDGVANLADVQPGDRVLAQVRLPRRRPVTGTVAARKLVDRTHPKVRGTERPADDEAGAGDRPS